MNFEEKIKTEITNFKGNIYEKAVHKDVAEAYVTLTVRQYCR